ncbi:putative D,D-dipeptide-binding periplasmic protein DdpA [Streptomyces sp. RB5]|uniref:Putative D,D-dipeptide-binding periplasmic protein DdpA n=1 Tax=Streptomyces smaragdinus TaxID=2585196 RepID=A0A7K0CLR8_9ACTN|nr:ABC transporter substrate-binding protein [Streptomyces smaragdinus]MQY13962.1 putative D,D-dipeptide-binding periplasmic protein DdpA [Streptomyces smaragdinus]
MRYSRQLLRLAALPVAISLLAGCSGGLFGEGDEAGPIVVGTTDSVTSLDPSAAYDAGSWAIISTLHQGLMTFEPSGSTPVPDAAKECSFTDDKTLKTFRCELRDGLKFSNGDKLTAEDVKFSFERVRSYYEKNKQGGPWPVLGTLDTVEAEGDAVVVFHLATPDATWPYKLASAAGVIVDKDAYPDGKALEGDDVVGSGPYVLKSYDAGKSAVLERNANYKGAFEVQNDAVTIKYYESPDKLLAAWKDGGLDAVSRDLPAKAYRDIEDNPESDVRVAALKGSSVRHMVFNVKDGSRVKSPAIRKAIAALVDRQAIARNVHFRTVDPLYSLIPAGVAGHTTAFYDRLPRTDPAEAQKILAEAGIATPVTFTLAYRKDAGFEEETKVLVKQLEQNDLFKVELDPRGDDFFDMVNAGKTDAFTVGWLPDFPDPGTYVSPVVGKGNTFNNGYSSPKVNELIKRTEKVSARTRTLSDNTAIDDEVAKDLPLLPLYQSKDYTLTTDHILGGEKLLDSTGAWRVWELSRE